MASYITFPSKVFNGRRYALQGVYLSKHSAQVKANAMRRDGLLARVAVAKADTLGRRRIGYFGVYFRSKYRSK